LVAAHSDGQDSKGYWVAVPVEDVDREMAKIPPVVDHQIDGIRRSAARSYVMITVTPQDGQPLQYEITLLREGVGWKVSGIASHWSDAEDTQ